MSDRHRGPYLGREDVKERAAALFSMGLGYTRIDRLLAEEFGQERLPSLKTVQNWCAEFRKDPTWGDHSETWAPVREDLDVLRLVGPVVAYAVEVAGSVDSGWPTRTLVAHAAHVRAVLPELEPADVHAFAHRVARLPEHQAERRRLELELLLLHPSPGTHARSDGDEGDDRFVRYARTWRAGLHDGRLLDLERWQIVAGYPRSERQMSLPTGLTSAQVVRAMRSVRIWCRRLIGRDPSELTPAEMDEALALRRFGSPQLPYPPWISRQLAYGGGARPTLGDLRRLRLAMRAEATRDGRELTGPHVIRVGTDPPEGASDPCGGTTLLLYEVAAVPLSARKPKRRPAHEGTRACVHRPWTSSS